MSRARLVSVCCLADPLDEVRAGVGVCSDCKEGATFAPESDQSESDEIDDGDDDVEQNVALVKVIDHPDRADVLVCWHEKIGVLSGSAVRKSSLPHQEDAASMAESLNRWLRRIKRITPKREGKILSRSQGYIVLRWLKELLPTQTDQASVRRRKAAPSVATKDTVATKRKPTTRDSGYEARRQRQRENRAKRRQNGGAPAK